MIGFKKTQTKIVILAINSKKKYGKILRRASLYPKYATATYIYDIRSKAALFCLLNPFLGRTHYHIRSRRCLLRFPC